MFVVGNFVYLKLWNDCYEKKILPTNQPNNHYNLT